MGEGELFCSGARVERTVSGIHLETWFRREKIRGRYGVRRPEAGSVRQVSGGIRGVGQEVGILGDEFNIFAGEMNLIQV